MLKIDLYSDVICPWCFVGKRRLEEALKKIDSSDIEVVHRPFELNPHTPKSGVNRKEYLESRFGDSIHQAHERLSNLGREVGIDFQFDRAQTIPNTFDAHRLVWWAGTENPELQMKLVDALHEAYFTEGLDVGMTDVLIQVAVKIGFAEADVRRYLESDSGTSEVRGQEEMAGKLGITGVPFFVLDGRLGVSGAQSVQTLIDAISQARE